MRTKYFPAASTFWPPAKLSQILCFANTALLYTNRGGISRLFQKCIYLDHYLEYLMSYTSKAVDFMSISTIAQFGQIVVVTSPLFQKISQIGHSLSAFSSFFFLCAFSSFFLNRFSQKWRHLYGQKWQMAALNSIRMTNLDESGSEAICDVIFCLSKNHLSDPRN